MATHPMSPVDAAWYHIDGPMNLGMITSVLLFKSPLDFERVKGIYRERIRRYPRFSQRVVERGIAFGTPHWEDMPHFDIAQHVHHIALPAPGDQAALIGLFNDLASTPLDREQPLWQVTVVDGVDGGSALVTRLHHCIGDGTALMAFAQHLFDSAPDSPPAPATTAPASAPKGVLVNALAPVARTARRLLAAAGDTFDAVIHPRHSLETALTVLAGAGMLAKELLKWPDPVSPLKGDFGMRKHVAWSRPVAIADVKEIGAPSGAKVNDVLVAGMTGALRHYLKQRGVDVNDTTVRAMVPVDLRAPERAHELGNEFGLVVLDLAVASGDAMKRLALTKTRMDALKRSPEPVAMYALFNIFGRGPKAIEDLANRIFGSKASVVMTNVSGPRTPLYLAGVAVDRMLFWVPHPGRDLGMGISILSYRGAATLAVVADARLVPDPEAITDRFHVEFQSMLKRVRRAAEAAPVAPKPAASAKSTAKPKAAAPRRTTTSRAAATPAAGAGGTKGKPQAAPAASKPAKPVGTRRKPAAPSRQG